MGHTQQAQLGIKSPFSPFSCQCSTLCIICPHSTAQQAAAASGAAGALPGTPKQHFLQTGHVHGHTTGTQNKLLLLRKECLFSAQGGLTTKISSISYKNTCTEEKISCDSETCAEHQNLCWGYLSRDSNWCLSTPDDAFISSEEFSFTIKIITQ